MLTTKLRLNDQQVRAMRDRRQRRAEKKRRLNDQKGRATEDQRKRRVENEVTTQRSTCTFDAGTTTTTC